MASATRHHIYIKVLLIFLFWGAAGLAGELYHWTDENGVRHYSNTRPPGGIEATVLMEEIPYDPEAELLRREREQRLQEEREAAEIRERLEAAEREAETARREAEAARRKAERLEDELEDAQESDRSYGIYIPYGHPGYYPPGHRPPGHRPPGHRPPGHRPPGHRPPDHGPPAYQPPRGDPPPKSLR